jgi:hypothetical protein
VVDAYPLLGSCKLLRLHFILVFRHDDRLLALRLYPILYERNQVKKQVAISVLARRVLSLPRCSRRRQLGLSVLACKHRKHRKPHDINGRHLRFLCLSPSSRSHDHLPIFNYTTIASSPLQMMLFDLCHTWTCLQRPHPDHIVLASPLTH